MDQIRLRVKKKISETARATSFVLEPLESYFEYQAGQFITLIFSDLASEEVRRSYSLSSAPGIDPLPVITVQRVPNGLVSRYLIDKVEEGDILSALNASGQFTRDESKEAHSDLFLIGGGSGVTPLISILKVVLQNERETHVKLFLSNRSEEEIIFKEVLDKLAIDFQDRVHIRHVLSSWNDNAAPLEKNIEFIHGRMSNYFYEKWITEFLHFDPKHAGFFICGPKGLMLKAESTIRYMGFEEEQIKKEVFDVVAPFRPKATDLQDAMIEIHRGSQQDSFLLEAGQNILEAAQQSGINLPFSCRSGICTTCTATCLSGRVVMYGQDGVMTTDELKGTVLTCVGYPSTDKVVIAYE